MELHSRCQIELEARMCVLNTCAPGSCVPWIALFLLMRKACQTWAKRYTTEWYVHFSRCQVVNRVGGLWQWRYHQSKTREHPLYNISFIPTKHGHPKDAIQWCLRELFVFCIHVKVRKDMTMKKKKGGHFVGLFVGLLFQSFRGVWPLYKNI